MFTGFRTLLLVDTAALLEGVNGGRLLEVDRAGDEGEILDLTDELFFEEMDHS